MCERHDSDVTERNKQYDFAKPRKARDLYLQRGEVDSTTGPSHGDQVDQQDILRMLGGQT